MAEDSGRLYRPLVWIDLEMTGLDPEIHTIIEIACLITDGNLRKEQKGPNLVIHQPEDVLSKINEWSLDQHSKSGLLQKVKNSSVTIEEAEEQVLQFMANHTLSGVPQLAGNSVHVDLMFLRKYMPKVYNHLNYRIVDVSSIKELCKRWYPKVYSNQPKKALKHTAFSDIQESLEELKYYRKKIFKKTS